MTRLFIALIALATLALGGCASHIDPGPRPGQTSTRTYAPQRTYEPKTQPYTVLGKRYHPLKSAAGYDETGTASWYGKKFHGKLTASGDRYDMHEPSAAHKTLPMGTIVRVTNLENGRVATLLVNDRGPFVGNRIIDLSYAAAQDLGTAEKGLSRVRVQAVGSLTRGADTQYATAPTRPVPSAKPAPAAKTASATGNVYLQIGVFAERDNALRVRDHLRGRGFPNVFITSGFRQGRLLHTVKAGFNRESEARNALSHIRAYYPDTFLKT